MKDKKNMTDQEFEIMLKEKMNKLSDHVDCFGKISERVFHEEDAEFEDSEFIVTELENITGKKRYSPLFKGLACGMAAVFAIAFIPRTAMFQKVMCNIGTPDSDIYGAVLNDIISYTSDNIGKDFSVYDMTFEEYVKKDVLVTPLFRCPFEDIGREDVRVRIFIRNYNECQTNQIYAVEYSGEYTEENFIAAAETNVEFSEEELASEYQQNADRIAVPETCGFDMFTNDINSFCASFVQHNIYKDLSDIYSFASVVSYFTCDNGESYTYKTENFRTSDTSAEQFEIPQNALKWRYSVYSDGESALPEENSSIFKEYEENTANSDSIAHISFEPYLDTEVPITEIHTDITSLSISGKSIDIPSDSFSRLNLTLYLTENDFMFYYYSSESDPKLTLSSSDDSVSKAYRKNDFSFDEQLSVYYYTADDSVLVDGDISVSPDENADGTNQSFEETGDIFLFEQNFEELPNQFTNVGDQVTSIVIKSDE